MESLEFVVSLEKFTDPGPGLDLLAKRSHGFSPKYAKLLGLLGSLSHGRSAGKTNERNRRIDGKQEAPYREAIF